MQDRPLKGLPSVASLRLPIQFLYSLRLNTLPSAFRVAGFGRVDLTLFPEISPVTCEGDTTVMLADCVRLNSYLTAIVASQQILLQPMSTRLCDS